MSRLLAVPLVLAVVASLDAATTPASRPNHSVAPSAESIKFARDLFTVLNEIAEVYVRPVERADLVRAAVAGLYEVVRQPVPPRLLAEIDQASTQLELMSILTRAHGNLAAAEELSGNQALIVSLRAVARALDPHTMLLPEEESRRARGELGVGLVFAPSVGNGPLTIRDVIPGSPAQRAGLRPGDVITEIEGRPVNAASAAVLRQDFDDARGAQRFSLTVRRGPSVRTAVLTCEPFDPEWIAGVNRRFDNTWNWYLDERRRIAYVRFGSLEPGVAYQLRTVLLRLKPEGLSGVILDLRWCPGGSLQEAANIARLFVPDGPIAKAQYRNKNALADPFQPSADNALADVPLLALVSGQTTGGGELIAAALQDNQRAIIFGERTFGKGTIQTILPNLPIPELQLKVTSGSFIRGNGKPLHRFPESKPSDDWGVRPDPGCEMPLSPELNRKLKEWYQLHTLRPGSSLEPLPLDDPENDPQRQAALRKFRQTLGAGGPTSRKP
ncbi:MAG: S41 family peptidase [Gemmataceae bacterium]|nr:S41 family peptidase [Gemmataceae bacterium]MDW8266813.1 S41 family peptidase [Gemmataceae bacterium]